MLELLQTVEAARECGMASVVIAGRKPLYELKAADLVVKHISELRVVNLKQLFRNEDLVAATVRSALSLLSGWSSCQGQLT